MFVYFILFFLLAFASLIESIGDVITSRILLLINGSLLIILATFRNGIGTDYFNYLDIYKNVVSHKPQEVEIGFLYLNYVAIYFFGFKSLLFLSATINISSLVYILHKFKVNISVGLLTYYSLFYLNHNFNTMRHGLMCMLVWLGFSFYFERKKIKSLLTYFVASTFHILAIFFIPLSLFFKKHVTLRSSLIFLVVAYLIGQVTINIFEYANIYISIISPKLNYYLTDYYGDEVVKYELGFGFLLYILIFVLISMNLERFKNREQILFFNKMLYLGIFMILLFVSISIFTERIANLLLVSLVFIFSSVNYIKGSNSLKFLILGLIILVDLFYFIKISHLPGILRTYQYIPYTYSV